MWKDNKINGIGEYHYPGDTRVFKGEYKNDKKHGKGVIEWSDGRKFVGNFIDGQ